MSVYASQLQTVISHTLCDQTVKVLVVRSFNAKVATANVVDRLIVDHEGAVAVLQGGVCGKDRVVRLDYRCGDLRSWVDAELELALLAVVDRQSLHEQRTETGTSTTTEAVEDKEALETRAVVCNSPDLVQHLINELLADSVVPTCIVV